MGHGAAERRDPLERGLDVVHLEVGQGERVARPGVLAQPDAASARREEARIKRLPRREKLALIAPGGGALPCPSERAVGRARGPAVTPSE